MGRFSYIAYLCREGDRDKLREEVSSMAKAMGRSSEDVADEFIYAFNNAVSWNNSCLFFFHSI